MTSAALKQAKSELGTHTLVCSLMMLLLAMGSFFLCFPSYSRMGGLSLLAGLGSFYGITRVRRNKIAPYLAIVAGIIITYTVGSCFIPSLPPSYLSQCFIDHNGKVWDGYANGLIAPAIVNRCVPFSYKHSSETEIGGYTYQIHCRINKTKGSVLYQRLGEKYEKLDAVLKPVLESFDDSTSISEIERRASRELLESEIADLVFLDHTSVNPTENLLPES